MFEIDWKDLKGIYRNSMRNKTLNLFVKDIIITGKENFPKLRNQRVAYFPMHQSLFDFVALGHLFLEHHIPYPLFVAGKNLDFFPVNKSLRFGKWGAYFIERGKKGTREERKNYWEKVRNDISNLVLMGFSSLTFVEGSRSYSGKPMERVQTLILDSVLDAQKRIHEDITGINISIRYDKRPEDGFFEILAYAKKHNLEWLRRITDISAFLSRPFRRPTGNMYIDFHKPYSLVDFKNKKELADYIKQDLNGF